MSVDLSQADLAAISARQVNIVTENTAYNTSLTNFTSTQAQLLAVDTANGKFYYDFDNQARQYEAEAEQINGQVAAEYQDSDLVAAAQTPANVLFFPSSSGSSYIQLIPCIQDGTFTNNTVKGIFYPTSTDTLYEFNLINNPTTPASGLTQLLGFLLNGISSSSATATSTGSVAAGSGTFTLVVTAVGTFSPGEYVYATSGAYNGIYKVVSYTPGAPTGSLVITSILPTLVGMSSPSISSQAAGFTNAQRQSLTSGSYQEILTNLASNITSLISTWQTKLSNQLAALNSNDDSRSTQVNQIQSTISMVNSATAILTTWQTLLPTGLTGQFTNASLSPIQSLMTSRTTIGNARLAQILVALGGTGADALTQSAETYSATDTTNVYYMRYKWLNARINRSTGSLRRYYASMQGSTFIQQALNSNNMILGDYSTVLLTKQILVLDTTNIIQLTNYSGLSIGDQIYVITNKQPAIPRVIKGMQGTNQIVVDTPVPSTYQVIDVARIYKEL